VDLKAYLNRIREQYEKGNYKVLDLNGKPESNKLSIHIESLNYLLYEWNEDNKDPRNIFDYVIVPDDCDFDFESIKFEEFFDFLTKQKDKDNVMFDISTKEVLNKPEDKPVKEEKSKPSKKEKAEPVKEIKKETPKEEKSEPVKEVKKETPKQEKVKPKKEPIKEETPKPVKKFDYESKNTNPKLGSFTNNDDWDF